MSVEQVNDLSARLRVVEAAFEEVKQLKGIAGPRGPAGNIGAAESAAQRVVAEAEARVQVRADESYTAFLAEVKTLRADFEKLRKSLDDKIQNTVDSMMLQTLQDYGVLDSNNVPYAGPQSHR